MFNLVLVCGWSSLVLEFCAPLQQHGSAARDLSCHRRILRLGFSFAACRTELRSRAWTQASGWRQFPPEKSLCLSVSLFYLSLLSVSQSAIVTLSSFPLLPSSLPLPLFLPSSLSPLLPASPPSLHVCPLSSLLLLHTSVPVSSWP